ncbi:hypothetical protein BV25DRAFT_1596956 [Artomyces pyxidatus]|uniref:Uncharacterized protein n=1 Tax=Artomyces pyxidatus TaxID=48021 RepID=A0ACB8TAG5_9AGAM|nr:hypothetical protein BV25DRAFT_1596956 [Artomyces pyxidatus]
MSPSSTPAYSFDASDADIILQSHDTKPTDFRVHRCILSAASPFFQTMFTLPQPHQSTSTLPTIPVAEDAPLLDMLLRFVYPIPDPTITTLDELVPLMGVATKYEMDAVIGRLRHILMSECFLTASPVRVFAIASRFELEAEARLASRHTLRVNVLDSPLSDDLKHISAYSYHRLLDLHRRRGEAAQQALCNPDEIKCMQCNGSSYNSFARPKWWGDFLVRASEELRRRPTTDVIFSLGFLMQSAHAAGCPRCAGSILESHVFLQALKDKIDALPSTI